MLSHPTFPAIIRLCRRATQGKPRSLHMRGAALMAVIACPAFAGAQTTGRIVAFGDNTYNQISNVPTGSDFIQVAGGGDVGYALRSNGTIAAWGRDVYGEVSNAPTGNDFVQVAGGLGFGYALHANGTITTWGRNTYTNVSGTPTGTGYKQISAADYTQYAIRADGSIVGWGLNSGLQLSHIPSGTGFVQVVGLSNSAVALKSDGSLASWYQAGVGYVPSGNNFVSVSYAAYGIAMALRSDGTIDEFAADTGEYHGYGSYPTTSDFFSIGNSQDVNGNSPLAVKKDGSLATWASVSRYVNNLPTAHNFFQVASGQSTGYALAGSASAPDASSIALLLCGGVTAAVSLPGGRKRRAAL